MTKILVTIFFLLGSVAQALPVRSNLKMVCAEMVSDAQGSVIVDIKIPGLVGSDTRIVEGGTGWFDNPTQGDRLATVDIVDKDSIILGGMMLAGMDAATALAAATEKYPRYPTVGSFSEESLDLTPPAVRGWFMTFDKPLVVKSIGGSEELTSGLYLRFIAKKNSPVVDIFRVNIYWGEP